MIDYEKKDIAAKILPRIKDDDDFPGVILIDNISFCNLKCAMCAHKEMTRKPGIMSEALYNRLIDEIADNRPDAQIWITFFGEGMIMKDLPDRIRYAVDKGVTNIMFNSNGALFKTDYSKRLIKAGLKKLLIGIDAAKEATYNQIRIGGNYDVVINGCLEYKKLLDEIGDPTQEIVVQFVEMNINRDEVHDFVKFWNSYGIQCKIRPMVSWAGKVDADNLLDDYERLPCYWAMNAFNVADDGTVPLCTCDLDCGYVLGNVREHTIKELWNDHIKKFRDMHRYAQWDQLPEMCANCKDWQSGYARYE